MRALALLTVAAMTAACAVPKSPANASEPEPNDHSSCDARQAESRGIVAERGAPVQTASAIRAAESSLPPPALALGEASSNPATAPVVSIVAPARDAHVDSDASVTLDVRAWPTAEGAAHVHLILDNQPYKPIYDTAAPVPLRDLNGGRDLAPGPHVLVAFASRANHESVKVPSAISVASFVVGTEPARFASPEGFLVYSRPKGSYAGPQANHVLVDFQLVGTSLAEGGRAVVLEVRGDALLAPLRARTSRFGAPFYLENLRSGTYTIELALVDGADKLVDGTWNKTTRTITIDRAKKP